MATQLGAYRCKLLYYCYSSLSFACLINHYILIFCNSIPPIGLLDSQLYPQDLRNPNSFVLQAYSLPAGKSSLGRLRKEKTHFTPANLVVGDVPESSLSDSQVEIICFKHSTLGRLDGFIDEHAIGTLYGHPPQENFPASESVVF